MESRGFSLILPIEPMRLFLLVLVLSLLGAFVASSDSTSCTKDLEDWANFKYPEADRSTPDTRVTGTLEEFF